MVRALGETGEWTIAVDGDVLVLDVWQPDDGFVRPVRELHDRHGDARVMKSGARDREDGTDLTGYTLARATVISGDGEVRG